MRLTWSAPALEDIDEILIYLGEHDPATAIALVDDIQERVAILAEFPEAGRPGRIDGTRELLIGSSPYIVAYRVQRRRERVQILAVRHAARRWPTQF